MCECFLFFVGETPRFFEGADGRHVPHLRRRSVGRSPGSKREEEKKKKKKRKKKGKKKTFFERF